ncbi:MAG: hypothetical protein LPK19_11445, partial [Hymenobacteraceae bacterium]|nr:hypothetical protein [Hymenobacteraceae bacterium]MDX5396840.1 hypothetical protein [Hymenobacteraceae bacterium]MDX5512911.1 hypothetical protein [Hymenobacteraceae bacterium]
MMRMLTGLSFIVSVLISFTACTSGKDENQGAVQAENSRSEELISNPDAEGKLSKIKLPPGFKIDYYATGVENARSMALSPSGVLYVGTRDEDKV